MTVKPTTALALAVITATAAAAGVQTLRLQDARQQTAQALATLATERASHERQARTVSEKFRNLEGTHREELARIRIGNKFLKSRFRIGNVHQVRFGKFARGLIILDLRDGAQFAILHIGLIKSIDSQNMAGHRNSDLPAEKFRARVVEIGNW